MKVISKIFIFLNVLIFNSLCKAEFIEGSIWHKKMPTNRDQYIVFIGDQHETYNQKQVDELLQGMPNHSLALVEDMPAYTASNEKYNLSNLTKKIPIANNTIKAINVECRNIQFKIGFLQGAAYRLVHLLPMCDAHMCLTLYLENIQKIKAESMTFNDGANFNAIYTKLRLAQHQLTSNVEDLRDKYKTACINNAQSFTVSYLPEMEMIHAVSAEVDIRALHQIYLNPDKQFIFVIAGAWHTRNMESVLSSLGYSKQTSDNSGSLKVKELLAQLPSENNQASKKDDTKLALHSALATTCLLPGVKYAPQTWNNSWKNYRPTAAHPLANLRRYMTRNLNVQSLNFAARMRTLLHDQKPSFTGFSKQTHTLPKPTLAFKATRLRNLPRALKVGAAASLGLGLAALYKNKSFY